MSDSKSPQPKTTRIVSWSIEGCMSHHQLSPVPYGLNGSFSLSILMLRTYNIYWLRLLLVVTIREKMVWNKYTVVGMITFGQHSSQIPDPLFKRQFLNYRLPSPHRHLRLSTDKIRGGVLKYCLVMKIILCYFASIALLKSSRSLDNKLVGGNTISRILLIMQ